MELLIRNIEPSTVHQLKVQAKSHHRSLQGELKFIIESATKMSMQEAQQLSSTWQKRLAGSKFSDSTKLLREDRKR